MRWTFISLRQKFELLVTEATEFAWSKDEPFPTGVVKLVKLNGGSSGDEKSELSKVDRDTHSSK